MRVNSVKDMTKFGKRYDDLQSRNHRHPVFRLEFVELADPRPVSTRATGRS